MCAVSSLRKRSSTSFPSFIWGKSDPHLGIGGGMCSPWLQALMPTSVIFVIIEQESPRGLPFCQTWKCPCAGLTAPVSAGSQGGLSKAPRSIRPPSLSLCWPHRGEGIQAGFCGTGRNLPDGVRGKGHMHRGGWPERSGPPPRVTALREWLGRGGRWGGGKPGDWVCQAKQNQFFLINFFFFC